MVEATLVTAHKIFHNQLSKENNAFTLLPENIRELLSRTCLLVRDELAGNRFGFIGKVNRVGHLEVIAICDPALGYLSGHDTSGWVPLSIYYRFYQMPSLR
jgi:hypothetical protein